MKFRAFSPPPGVVDSLFVLNAPVWVSSARDEKPQPSDLVDAQACAGAADKKCQYFGVFSLKEQKY